MRANIPDLWKQMVWKQGENMDKDTVIYTGIQTEDATATSKLAIK